MEVKSMRPPAVPIEIRNKIIEIALEMLLNAQPNTTRFFYYMDFKRREPRKIICATKWFNKRLHIRVAVIKTFNKTFVSGDMKFTYCAGYGFDWFNDDPELYENDWLNWNPSAYYIGSIGYEDSKYNHSGFEIAAQDGSVCGLLYLAMWEQHKSIEYLSKAGLAYLSLRMRIVKKIEKDKNFVKYLLKNKKDIRLKRPGIPEIFYGYKNKLDINLAIELKSVDYNSDVIKAWGINGIGNLVEYLTRTHQSMAYYIDYFDACVELGVDMTDSKNKSPKDLKYWHDIRTGQVWQIKNKKICEEMVETYKKYQKCELKSKNYVVLIAKSHDELVAEGEALHHCVGRMNYDKKIAEQSSLIAFVRRTGDQSTPFVTVELDIKAKDIRQCYAKNNSCPDSEVAKFIYETWKPYAIRKIEKIAA